MSQKNYLKTRNLIALTLCATTIFSLTACQKSPEKSIVVNKDLDKLIEQAEKPEENNNTGEPALETDGKRYKTTFEDKNLNAKVIVDAEVDAPEAEQMSIYRVEHQEITQELIDTVRKELLGDTVLYDGMALGEYTRADMEENIGNYRSELALLEENGQKDSDSYKMFQEKIDLMESSYENAPTEITVTDYEYNGKLNPVSEICKEYPVNEKSDYFNSEIPEGNIFYGITDGSDGNYSLLYAMNSEYNSNCIHFHSTRHGYPRMGTYSSDDFSDPYNMPVTGDVLPSLKDETAKLSLEEATAIADDFLKKVGINNGQKDFRLYYGKRVIENIDYKRTNDLGHVIETRKCYLLRYKNWIEGAGMTTDKAWKTNHSNLRYEMVPKCWPPEDIYFCINDNGIVGFTYVSPLRIKETVVERATLKSFEEICDIFEKMSPIVNAQRGGQFVLTVDRVELGYTLISEPDSYNTGLLVPTWVFYGTKKFDGALTQPEECNTTINAIDGSIIDRTLGY